MDEWLRVNGSCPLCRKRIVDDSGDATNERTDSSEALMVPLQDSQTPNSQQGQNPLSISR